MIVKKSLQINVTFPIKHRTPLAQIHSGYSSSTNCIGSIKIHEIFVCLKHLSFFIMLKDSIISKCFNSLQALSASKHWNAN